MTLRSLVAVVALSGVAGCAWKSESAQVANDAVRRRVEQAYESSRLESPSVYCSDSAVASSGPATTQTATQPSTTQPAFEWEVAWQGWEGLHIELARRTRFQNPEQIDTEQINLEEIKFTAQLGARVEVDAAAFSTNGDLTGFDDGAQLRRFLLLAKGQFALIVPIGYDIQIGYRPTTFDVNEAIFTLPHVKYIGATQFGYFGPPMGLDLITSSRDITFMEPAAPMQAIAPGNEAGIQIGEPVLHQRGTWALGIFGNGTANSEYGNASENYGNLIGRITWLVIDQLNEEVPASNTLLHLGLSTSFQYSTTSTVRYRSRPESYLAPFVIDTGDIDARGAATVGAEAAYVHGPLSVQAEFIDSVVAPNHEDALNFYGFYVEAGWYFTGESRPYDRTTGAFKRLIPRRNFRWGGDGAWGAVEAACRFSYTNLSDGPIDGGRLSVVMGALNWYLQPHIKWVFNAGIGNVSGGDTQDGGMLIFQTRVGIDF